MGLYRVILIDTELYIFLSLFSWEAMNKHAAHPLVYFKAKLDSRYESTT